jgi:hypothetical protein
MSRDERFNAMKWCLDNNIKIYPVTGPKAPTYFGGKIKVQKVNIEINNRGKISLDKNWYTQEEVTDKIIEYYKYYYDGRVQ